MTRALLTCHPRTPCRAVHGIRVDVQRWPCGTLQLTFSVEGDIRELRLPGRRAPRFANDLWRHTCFEAFLAVQGAGSYHEYNFSPSREWALFAFRRYRNGAPVAGEGLAAHITRRTRRTRFELTATVALDRVSTAYRETTVRLGLSAVMEERDGSLSYWALRHPAERPDFHLAEARALRLSPSS